MSQAIVEEHHKYNKDTPVGLKSETSTCSSRLGTLRRASLIGASFPQTRQGEQQSSSCHLHSVGEGLPISLICQEAAEAQCPSPNLCKQPKDLARSESRPCRKACR